MTKRKYRKRQFLQVLYPFIYKKRRKSLDGINNHLSVNERQLKFPDGLESAEAKVESIEKSLGQNELCSLQTCPKNKWFIIGASVKGNGHLAQNQPCQDAHKITFWENGWGIAVVSDGAGSAANADKGSAFVVTESVQIARELISEGNWICNDYFPKDQEWDVTARELFARIQNGLIQFALKDEIPIKNLHATLIVVIFSPHGLLIAHVGDGRAGFQDVSSVWKAMITPYEGEQVGETVFMTMDMKKHPQILETKVVREKVQAFTLMSDGCEKVCWNTLQWDNISGKFIKPNTPFTPFFEKLRSFYKEARITLTNDRLSDHFYMYIKEGHTGFRSETDDKTMIIGFTNL